MQNYKYPGHVARESALDSIPGCNMAGIRREMALFAAMLPGIRPLAALLLATWLVCACTCAGEASSARSSAASSSVPSSARSSAASSSVPSSAQASSALSQAQSSAVEYAQWFSITEEGSVVVYSPQGAAPDTLVPPLKRMVCMSSSYVGYLDAIGASASAVGVSGKDYLGNPRVKAAAVEVGYDAALDYEAIVRARPDVFLTYAVGAVEPPYLSKLRDLGIRCVVLSEHLESHPLARAEYVKLFGALTGRSSQADSVFTSVRDRYLSLVQHPDSEVVQAGSAAVRAGSAAVRAGSAAVRAGSAAVRAGSAAAKDKSAATDQVGAALTQTGPAIARAGIAPGPLVTTRRKVLINIPYADIWYIPGGDNYMARLVQDAGGELLGSVPGRQESGTIGLEQAYAYAQEADVWLNPGWCRTRDQLRSVHPLFRDFPVLGRAVWNNTLQETPGGGNLFWETGPVHPDWILEDLVHIFSGTSAPMHYFFPLPAASK